jgi:hypothetical protein
MQLFLPIMYYSSTSHFDANSGKRHCKTSRLNIFRMILQAAYAYLLLLHAAAAQHSAGIIPIYDASVPCLQPPPGLQLVHKRMWRCNTADSLMIKSICWQQERQSSLVCVQKDEAGATPCAASREQPGNNTSQQCQCALTFGKQATRNPGDRCEITPLD